MTLPFFTIGHSNRSIGEFVELLQAPGIERVVDVRHFPMSRANPQFNVDTLPGTLAPYGMTYEHLAALGGLRGKTSGLPVALNGYWKNRSFHNYADYALSEAFRSGLEHLIEEGHEHRCAIMCAEAVWWRCHRRLIADNLIARGETVFHIMGEGRLELAQLTPGAIVHPDGSVSYPARAGDDTPKSP